MMTHVHMEEPPNAGVGAGFNNINEMPILSDETLPFPATDQNESSNGIPAAEPTSSNPRIVLPCDYDLAQFLA